MAKKLITFSAMFEGSIEIDTQDYPGYSMEDILLNLSHEELFAGCESDLSPELIRVESIRKVKEAA